MTTLRIFAAIISIFFSISLFAQDDLETISVAKAVPSKLDYSYMWWPDGLRGRSVIDYPPGNELSERYIRCIGGGHFGAVFDVENVQVLRIADFPDGLSYEKFLEENRDDFVASLGVNESALDWNLLLGRERFNAYKSGVIANSWEDAPIVESGRFVQRFLLENVRFRNDEKELEDGNGRLEILAWPDHCVITGTLERENTEEETGTNWKLLRAALKLSNKIPGEEKPSVIAHENSTLKGNVKPGDIVSVSCGYSSAGAGNENRAITVKARDIVTGKPCDVVYDELHRHYVVLLDGMEPELPERKTDNISNDILERIEIEILNPVQNPSEEKKTGNPVRLMFRKFVPPFSITGMSAIIRDENGKPTGIPVQLSKNWHKKEEKPHPYEGPWFHGFTMLRMPPNTRTKFELNIAYAHWGGVPAVSHSQLSLIGWGNNQLWEEAAIGSWGESFCFEPDQGQKGGTVLDSRPLMIWKMENENPVKWDWTNNLGGADFLVYYTEERARDPDGKPQLDTNGDLRLDGKKHWPKGMKSMHLSNCPKFTEVVYSGQSDDEKISLRYTIMIHGSDDLARARYRFRYEVNEDVEFSRLVFFQCGGDDYSYTNEKKFAYGNEEGLMEEWEANTSPGVPKYRYGPKELKGRIPWISMHEAVSRDSKSPDRWGNRGLVLRSWNAIINGKEASPWIAERTAKVRGVDVSLVDFVPPPDVKTLKKGDVIEGEIVHVLFPMKADDYYGPNENLRNALKNFGNTWKPVHREAIGNDIQISIKIGKSHENYPPGAIVDETVPNGVLAEFTIKGGLGFVPFAFHGLPEHDACELFEVKDGEPVKLDQSIRGNDFRQCDYDFESEKYRYIYTLLLDSPDDVPLERTFILKSDKN